MAEIGLVMEVLRCFINDELLPDQQPCADPLADGRLDSLALEQLIDFAEERFEILLDQEEVERPRFASLLTFSEVVIRNLESSPYHRHVSPHVDT